MAHPDMNCHALICPPFSQRLLVSVVSAIYLSSGAAPAAAEQPGQDAPFGLWDKNLSAATAEPPQLTVARQEAGIALSWPASAIGWVVEQTADLQPPLAWAQVPPGLYGSDLTNISVLLPATEGNRFYRLRKLGPAIPGLTGNWTLDEGEGQMSQDSSGNDNAVHLTNVTWAPGRIGPGALWFNGGPAASGGSFAWISNTNYRVLPPTGAPFSIAFWFNPDSLSNTWSGLMGDDANGSNGWHLALHNPGPGTNELIFAAAGDGLLSVTGRTLLLPGQWHEAAVTYDGNEGVVYLDSEPLARATGALFANDQAVYFGGGVGGYDSFLGGIDEVRACTNALTAEDISLAGAWHFDENGGTLGLDSSIRGHFATIDSSNAWTTGQSGAGLNLSNCTVQIRNDDLDIIPPTGGPFSLSFWLYPYSLPEGWSGIMTCADSTNTGWSLSVQSTAAGQHWVHFSSTNSGGTLDLCSAVDLPEQVWTKLDLTFNGGIATLYVNGLKVKSDSGGIQGSPAPLVLGNAAGTTNFNGIIDELRIYKRERGEGEIGPVAKVMWETVLLNTTTNLMLQGFGPAGKPLTYTIVNTISPTNGTISHEPGSPLVTYTAGTNKGPDAFTYTVSDGEFTTPPTIVALSVVNPHWLSPAGGTVQPLDGSTPDQAWLAGPSDALDAVWRTNNYYDCFFYAPGEYQTTGWHILKRPTANRGCKHIGAGSEGLNQTTIKLVAAWESWNEGLIFGQVISCDFSVDFEVHDMVLDCNAANNPKYTQGEPIWIRLPLSATSHVDSVTLHWDNSSFNYVWHFGSAQDFSIGTRASGANDYVTNWVTSSHTGAVDTVAVGADTDEVILRMEQRAAGVDFYALAEVEVAGGTVSLPTATAPDGSESNLYPLGSEFGILRAVDGNDRTSWASGPEAQVRIELPLESATAVSRVNLIWNCQTLEEFRLGPAAEYRIQVRDPNTLQYYDVPIVRQPRQTNGLQITLFGTPGSPTNVITDRLVLLLEARELGVDFYSLSEVRLQNGAAPVALRLPTALNSLLWGDYQILRAFDGDPFTQWASDTQGMVGAVSVVGSNLKFTRLKIVGFGTKATRECFPLGIVAPEADYNPLYQVGNVLVEDCVFAQPALANTDGLTTLSVGCSPPHLLTNAVVRRCTVSGVKSHFRYSTAFSSIDVENCLVVDCQTGVYFEPTPPGDNEGPVLVRSNQFLNVNYGVALAFSAAARFESLVCVGNEIVLTGAGGWGFAALDTASPGPSGSTTNVTILNNIIRYGDWLPRPGGPDGGLYCSDIRNSVFGNNVILLGTPSALRLRPCPSGYIPPPPVTESCDPSGPIIPPSPGVTYPPCLDVLPSGYRRAWFNNRDSAGTPLKVRYQNTGVDGFALQQQWP